MKKQEKELLDIALGNEFWIWHLKPQQQNEKNKQTKKNKWDYMKLRSFCKVRKTINKYKDNLQNGDKKHQRAIYLIRD